MLKLKLAIVTLISILATPSASALAAVEEPPPVSGDWNASGAWSHQYGTYMVEIRSTVNRWMSCTVVIKGTLMDTREILPQYRREVIGVVLAPAKTAVQVGVAHARLANATWTADCIVHQDRWR
jgi:hypothetical protein